ncbi:L-lysine 2-3-aminomutase [Penicillium bovifimosum]|uniref:L-lysine 2-3-aminomutase n=1 Tax=Penicillium bovifimosum TaxID=126998 RepID=A0A9W9H5G7_9EURO|nr:L-lysine 2-3-aminomutase [Penicillium bovifimosum]KAJ5139012.1 L-lysine 2-3-aminomutase [Penicillium bovifimosum]
MRDAPSPDNEIQMQVGSSPGSHMSIDDVPSPAASSLQSEISMTDCAAHQIDSQDVEMSRTPTPPQQEKPVAASVLPRRPSPVVAGPSTTKEIVPSVVAAPGQGVAGYQDMAAPVESTDAKNKGNGKGKERDPGDDTMADGASTNAIKDGQASTSASQEMSTSSEQQAAWYGQLEGAISQAANHFLMEAHDDGHLTDHSLKRIREDRRARRLPALTDFRYDQLGQYQLVFDNFSKLYGSFGRTTVGSSFVLAAWRKLGTEICARNFANSDRVVKQHVDDAVKILALLRAEKSAIRSISELRDSVREVLEKGGGSSSPGSVHRHLPLPHVYIIVLERSPGTYDHRVWKTGLPVRSAVLKPHAGELVVGWVTTSESSLFREATSYNGFKNVVKGKRCLKKLP